MSDSEKTFGIGWPRSWPLRILAAVWSLPGGVLSLVAVGVVALVDDISWDGGLQFVCKGGLAKRLSERGWAAFTFAWVRFYWMTPDEALRRHENRHVRQHLWLSAFMLPLYLLSLAISGYESNWFERDARAHEQA